MHNLKEKAFLGILWNGGGKIFHQVVLLIVKLILARLLIPQEFGIAAIAFILITSLKIINSFGTGVAFIQDRKSNLKIAQNTLFYLDATANIAMGVLGLILAVPAAQFFSHKLPDPNDINTLIWMFRITALLQFLNILTIIPGAMLQRNLKFKQKQIANLIGVAGYGIVAPVLAFMGMGAWSIVLAQVTNQVIQKFVLFSYYPFIPSLIFSVKIAKDYLKFGFNHFINSVIRIIIRKGDDTLIGRFLGPASLGFYSLGGHFASLIMSLISGVMNGVMFPVFSEAKKDKKLYEKTFFKAFKLNNFLAIPAIIGAVALAPEIVKVTFGEKWLPIVPIFYILSISTFINNLVGIARPLLNSIGKPHLIRNNRLIQFGFYVVLIYPAILWGKNFIGGEVGGTIGVAIVMVIFSLVSLFHFFPILSREIKNFHQMALHVWIKAVPLAIVMGLIVFYTKQIFATNILTVILLVILGIGVYMGPLWYLDKELEDDVREGIRELKKNVPLLGKVI